jgi:uncharacterized protein (TIGR02996 family)
MSERDLLEELTQLMCADPIKTASILVCADHLEEQGDARAEYLRGQVALRELAADSEARHARLRQLRAIYPAGCPSWLARLEQAGVFESNLTGLPAGWWGQELPGRPRGGT